jgi:hypothetical protein
MRPRTICVALSRLLLQPTLAVLVGRAGFILASGNWLVDGVAHRSRSRHQRFADGRVAWSASIDRHGAIPIRAVNSAAMTGKRF